MTYSEAYSQVLQNIAALLGKERVDLVPFEDYDPITVDGAAWSIYNESRGVYNNWTGD